MPANYQTVAQMYQRLRVMIRDRKDTGFGIAAANTMLEPRNPFEPEARRKPKAGIAIGIALALVMVAVFLFFSFHPGR